MNDLEKQLETKKKLLTNQLKEFLKETGEDFTVSTEREEMILF
jgi:hypothetical protein